MYRLDGQIRLEFGIVDAIEFGVVNHFTCKERVDNTKFKANLTVQAVCIFL